MAIDYIETFINSDRSLSFNDLFNGIKILADIMQQKSNERSQEVVNRIASKLGISN